MPGKHRGESRRGKAAGLTRYTLDRAIMRELQAMAAAERRSLANMVSVLVTEALVARKRAK